ncbi:hypothetical protein LCA32G_1658, partial [Lacticaseibacillus paracasei]
MHFLFFLEETIMAYRHRATQLSFQSFNNGLGVPLSSDNEWVQLADMLPWQQLDEAYQLLLLRWVGALLN